MGTLNCISRLLIVLCQSKKISGIYIDIFKISESPNTYPILVKNTHIILSNEKAY